MKESPGLLFVKCFWLLLLAGCGLCRETTVQELTSPDGKYVATAWIRDCGATTPYNVHVDVRPVGQARNRVGNVYHGRLGNRASLAWITSTNLVITSSCMEVKRHITNLSGIKIDRLAW